MIRPFVGWDGESYSFDLGFGKTEIFLQIGLDSQLTELLSDLPDEQISRPVRRSSKQARAEERHCRMGEFN